MRTTVTIDDDVLHAARSIARSKKMALGAVLSELARRGLAPRPRRGTRKGFPVFSVAADAPPLTPEMVRRALEED